jgi:hypothetical protein
MIQNAKEIQKEFNLAIRHFRNAVKMAKKNLIIGEINFPTKRKDIFTGPEVKGLRIPRVRKAKVTPEAEGKETP